MTSFFYITTPIYYVNGLPHVGSALTTISCDVLARYHRLLGDNTYFVTGTDENATKVFEAAEKAGVPADRFVSQLADAFRTSWNHLHIAYDDFIRTTEKRHVRASQEFFARLLERGFVYRDSYEGWYSVSDETFFLDDKVKDGVAIESGKPVIWIKEQNYFFRLSQFAGRLLEYYESHPTFLMPEFRRNEVISFVNEGLRDMCITRANKGWGIEVPGDPTHVIYVWFEALINYLAATGWPDNPNWAEKWPPSLHMMGKEIFVRFHATLWPAMLMALDIPLPEQVYAHGWWTARGSGGKLGKSTGGLPTPEKFTALLCERAGISSEIAADAQRYILCREMNFGLDTDFSMESCLRRYNTDLANDLGNLLNRSVSMTVRYFDGVVPEDCSADQEITALARSVCDEYAEAMREVRLNGALEAVWKLVGRMNKYIDEKSPWKLANTWKTLIDGIAGNRQAFVEGKITESTLNRNIESAQSGADTNKADLSRVLYTCLEAARISTVLLQPFMPVAVEPMRAQLGMGDDATTWTDTSWGLLKPGARIGPAAPVFPRIADLTLNDEMLERLGVLVVDTSDASGKASGDNKENSKALETTSSGTGAAAQSGALVVDAPESATPEPPITIDDFLKIQLRVGEVLAAEPVANATKLLRLTVQVGEDDTRTILAGIAEYYDPDALVGRQVVLVANLAPRKMRGIESQGMLLAADVDGRAILLQPDSAVPSGSRVR